MIVVLLAVIPAALAGAGVFDSPDNIEYECPEADEGSKGVVGAPVEGPGAPETVEHEAPTEPENPCD